MALRLRRKRFEGTSGPAGYSVPPCRAGRPGASWREIGLRACNRWAAATV